MLPSRKGKASEQLHQRDAARRSLLGCFKQPVARLAAYGAVAALGLQGLVLAAGASYGISLFKENGPVEWLQFSLIAASALVLIRNSRTGRSAYPCLLLLAGLLALVAALRELDSFLDDLLLEDAYKYLAASAGALALYHVWKKFDELWREAAAFTLEASFFLFAFGFFLAAILAQVAGQHELWNAVLPAFSARIAKRVFEETIEAIGYLLIFFGAIETSFLKTRSNL